MTGLENPLFCLNYGIFSRQGVSLTKKVRNVREKKVINVIKDNKCNKVQKKLIY